MEVTTLKRCCRHDSRCLLSHVHKYLAPVVSLEHGFEAATQRRYGFSRYGAMGLAGWVEFRFSRYGTMALSLGYLGGCGRVSYFLVFFLSNNFQELF